MPQFLPLILPLTRIFHMWGCDTENGPLLCVLCIVAASQTGDIVSLIYVLTQQGT